MPNKPGLPKAKEGGEDGTWGAEATAGAEVAGAPPNAAPKLDSGAEAATEAAASVVAVDAGSAKAACA